MAAPIRLSRWTHPKVYDPMIDEAGGENMTSAKQVLPLLGLLVALGLLSMGCDGSEDSQESAAASPTGDAASLGRIAIPKIGVDAPVVTKSVDEYGVMQKPDGPWEVAWYDFTAQPGNGGNAVFAGLVEFPTEDSAVFFNLRDLAAGDAIEVRWSDGQTYRYSIASTWYTESDDPEPVARETSEESITLIEAWWGMIDPAPRRLIVRAGRVEP